MNGRDGKQDAVAACNSNQGGRTSSLSFPASQVHVCTLSLNKSLQQTKDWVKITLRSNVRLYLTEDLILTECWPAVDPRWIYYHFLMTV